MYDLGDTTGRNTGEAVEVKMLCYLCCFCPPHLPPHLPPPPYTQQLPCISASSCPLGPAYLPQDNWQAGNFSVKTAAQPNAQHAISWWLHAMQVLGASDSVKGKAIQHRLEMKGSIPPWVLDRFTGVIKDAHPAKFQVSSSCAFIQACFTECFLAHVQSHCDHNKTSMPQNNAVALC